MGSAVAGDLVGLGDHLSEALDALSVGGGLELLARLLVSSTRPVGFRPHLLFLA